MASINFPDNPSVNDTLTVGSTSWTWNGTVWQGYSPADNAGNDFVVAISGLSTSVNFGVEYPAGNYSITSMVGDASLDVYLFNSNEDFAGYSSIANITATVPFTKMVILGGTQGDRLSFEYKTIFVATLDSDEFKAGPFVLSVSPTAITEIDDTFEIIGGNFATDCQVFVRGQDSIEIEAKSVVRTSGTSLLVTRPDVMPEAQSPFDVIVRNPNIQSPVNSTVNILPNSVTPGSKPVWVTGPELLPFTKNSAYAAQLLALDPEEETLSYSIVAGGLPPGLSLDSATGIISGTPTGSSSAVFTVRVEDEIGLFLDREFTMPNSGPTWVTSSLPTAISGQAYNTTLIANDDSGVTPAFSLTGALPFGLVVNPATGVISGTTTSVGPGTPFTITATDANGRESSRTFTINVKSQIISTISTSGTLVIPETADELVEILAIGGGGSGGDGNAPGGGGGAGELIEGLTSLSPGTYSVTVGTGGAALTTPNASIAGNPGTATTLTIGGTIILQAKGGGAGGGLGSSSTSGGSGGGGAGPNGFNNGSPAGTAGVVPEGCISYRNAGANFSSSFGGGGGGAGGPGLQEPRADNGGAARVSSITGSSVAYGRGGNGGNTTMASTAVGFGHGGRASNDGTGEAGRNGALIVRYLTF